MSQTTEEVIKRDFSQDFKNEIPFLNKLISNEQNDEFFENLLSYEKKTRLANDLSTLKDVLSFLFNAAFKMKLYSQIIDNIINLSKKRGQKSAAVIHMVKIAMEHLPELAQNNSSTYENLLVALRQITDGKIYVEKERAQLTQLLSIIREKEGDIAEAANILQEVHVETYGAMTKLEKCEFILEQIRLVLANKDYVRANIVAKKILRRTLDEPGFEDCKIKFFKLMIKYSTHENETIELAKHWMAIFNTPKVTLSNETKWKEALEHAVLFTILSPFSNHQHDLLHRLALEKKIEDLPEYQNLLKLFTTKEIIAFPLASDSLFRQHVVFTNREKGRTWYEDLNTRVIEYNIRVIEEHYARICLPHLSKMLGLAEEVVEKHISTLVISGSIFAKIDRPGALVQFHKNKSPEEHLTKWSSDITKLLRLVETTCHLINKENMMHKV